jgi:hypothetical protein
MRKIEHFKDWLLSQRSSKRIKKESSRDTKNSERTNSIYYLKQIRNNEYI